MDEGSPYFSIIVIILCLIVNIIINGFMASVNTISEPALEEKKKENNKKADKLAEFKDNPVNLIGTVRAVTMLTTIIIFVFAYISFGTGLRMCLDSCGLNQKLSAFLSYLIIIFICLVINLAVGVLIPQKIASFNSEKVAFNLYNASRVIMVCAAFVTAPAKGIAKLILMLFKIDINKDYDEVTEEEIMSMVNEGHELGVIEASEAEMITNIFEYGDKDAADIMTHRSSIASVSGDITLLELNEVFTRENKSRLPVYIDNIDNIIGIVHIIDALAAGKDQSNDTKSIKDIDGLLTDVNFIPETRKIDALFKNMQRRKVHLVIVVDEYGQTAGLITMEDILEEIVGNILDEHDEELTNIVFLGNGTFRIDGMTTLEEIEEKLEISYEDEEYDTINGFLISKIGHIPEKDENIVIDVDGIVYKILAVENKKISLLELTLPKDK